MRVLLISPLGFSINPQARYVGIERLVWTFSKELTRQGHQVAVLGPSESEYPDGVTWLSAKKGLSGAAELAAYQLYNHTYWSYDALHDFSHHHFATRGQVKKFPCVSVFWHSPQLARYPKAPYDIIALSKWAVGEFQRVYGQAARYQETIIIDPDIYKPNGGNKRSERWLTIGRMAPEKGNLNAVHLCKKLGLSLDIAGGRGAEKPPSEPPDEYESAILKECDGKQIRFLGEVTEEEKVDLMQTCKGLIYITDHPEVTSHKIQEAMFCAAPVIAPRLGGVPEVVTDKVNGFLCSTPEEYEQAVRNIERLPLVPAYEALVRKYSPEPVIRGYVELYQKVAEGLRW